jgi:peptidoglycan/xylan/chitin deacetylase (PgdA/CDA1 family)
MIEGPMGAPAREWVIRSAVALGATAVVFVLFALPLGWPTRWVALGLTASIGFVQAFRRVPSFDPFRRVRSRVPCPGGVKRCAITFDDGPSAMTGHVLDVLQAEGVAATFFVLGQQVDKFPDLVRRADSEGHAIGIHGLDHRKLSGAGEAIVNAQLRGASQALARAGITPSRVYRTPHGFKSAGVFDAGRRHGLDVWAWSRGVWDTDRPAPGILVRRATRGAAPGMVLLLHDGRGDETSPDISPMIDALPGIIRTLKARGFSFVRLADV